MKNKKVTALAFVALLLMFIISGCGGGSKAQRPAGLDTDAVVKSFFEAAKANKMNEASLYISQDSLSDTKAVLKYVTGQSGVNELKNSNLLSVKKVAQQGDYAVVLATLQAETNTTKISVKPVGLTRVNNEWYIVDMDKILSDVKYKVLQQLLSNI